MAVDSHHPQYDELVIDLKTMRDAYEGERIVKEAGVIYLPPTAGHVRDGMQNLNQNGRKAYEAYKLRARFPDLVSASVEALVGVMHVKPPVIELPAVMEPMRDSVTLNNEGLEMLLRRINFEQLLVGRLGLLLDIEDGADVSALPYIATYLAESVINWDDGSRNQLVRQNLNMVTLDESEFVRLPDFEWEFKRKYRVAILGDPLENEPTGESLYQVGEFEEINASFNTEALIVPSIGGNTLNEIPFVFVNSRDIVPTPERPPLLGLADLAFGIYRGEADYRQALFMQGQDTLVVSGILDKDKAVATGANAVIKLPIGGKAEFIGVDSKGLSEMREALENDKKDAAARAGNLLDSSSRSKESGEALKIRVAASTATLTQIALSGAFGLEMSLKMAARWIGANEDEVVVTPNLDFVDDEMDGDMLVKLITAKTMGAPLSRQSLHENMQSKGLTKLTLEDEVALIMAEEPLVEVLDDDDDEGDGDGGGAGGSGADDG